MTDDFQEEDRQRLLDNYEVFEKNNKGEPTGKVNTGRLAKLLLEGDGRKYLVTKDNQTVIIYNGSYFEPCGEAIIRERVQYYLDDIHGLEYIKKEVVGYIRNHAYIEREKLEQPLNLINLKTGILNIDTSELIPHDAKYTFQFEIPVEYDPSIDCPLWKKFVGDVLYQEDIPFVQEVCGYLLHRGFPFALIVILLGHGRNGKTTFISTISAVMGEKNIEHIPIQTLAHERFAKAKLYEKHANLCSEIGASEIKDTATLKSLTGGDLIFARELYQNGFSFRNYAKLVSSCNLLPDIGDKTLAMTERLAVLEFPNTFLRGSPDCDSFLYDKLTTPHELSGILNWMVEGLKRLLENKTFSPFRNFENVTDYLKQNQDPVKMFADQYIDRDKQFQIHKDTTYGKYLAFTKEKGLPSLNDVWFGRKFKQFGPSGMTPGQPRTGGHKATWKGVKFKDGTDSFPNTDDSQDSLEVE